MGSTVSDILDEINKEGREGSEKTILTFINVIEWGSNNIFCCVVGYHILYTVV